jgi:hypothetical protein
MPIMIRVLLLLLLAGMVIPIMIVATMHGKHPKNHRHHHHNHHTQYDFTLLIIHYIHLHFSVGSGYGEKATAPAWHVEPLYYLIMPPLIGVIGVPVLLQKLLWLVMLRNIPE